LLSPILLPPAARLLLRSHWVLLFPRRTGPWRCRRLPQLPPAGNHLRAKVLPL